jgi:hypothetical protein
MVLPRSVFVSGSNNGRDTNTSFWWPAPPWLMFGDEQSRFDVAHFKASTWFGGGSVAEIDISGFLTGVSLSILFEKFCLR